MERETSSPEETEAVAAELEPWQTPLGRPGHLPAAGQAGWSQDQHHQEHSRETR